jgi:hypothetical protein
MTWRAWTASVLDLKDNIAGVSDRVTLTVQIHSAWRAWADESTIHGECVDVHTFTSLSLAYCVNRYEHA